MAKIYTVTENEMALLDTLWQQAKLEIMVADSQKTPQDIFRKLNYVLYGWIADIKR